IPLKTKSNKLIPVETRIKKGTWNGKPAIIGITKDISELEVSKEKFSKAFQNNPAIAGLSDLETGEYVEVNKTFYDKLEYTPKEVIGKKASEVVKMESKFREKTLSKLKKYNSIENVETVLYTKSGKPLNVILNAEIIVIDGRKFNYTSAIDITEKLEYEKILKINEENYRKFFENDITADSLIAADGTILSCNPSFSKLFGFKSCEDVVGYNAKLFFHSEKEMRYHFNRVIKEGKILNLEIELQDIKGEKKQVITNVVGEYDEQGKIKQFRSYINDITHKKKIEEELEKYRLQLEDLVKERTIELESEIIKRRKAEEQAMIALEKEKELGQLKSKFISTVSHEFRTPLTSIYSSVELIERYSSKWDNSQKSEHFSRIKTSIDHLTNMLEEVLRLNRSQSSSVEFNPNKIDLNIFCKNLINDLKPLLSKNNKLFYNFNIPLKNYLADENLLKV
ncbi:MAG: PAS domain-containing sensor histidine kinase, partial [Ignavibacteriae bacterium]|nr:PAS domain-containing sensor histidine kinase [Ignavibacteriota bacterium]